LLQDFDVAPQLDDGAYFLDSDDEVAAVHFPQQRGVCVRDLATRAERIKYIDCGSRAKGVYGRVSAGVQACVGVARGLRA
jgi:hypothetical protein